MPTESDMPEPSETAKRVVVIDDDRDVAEVVQTVLLDEGFRVSCLYDLDQGDVHAAINAIEPDCVLLDGAHRADFGASWELATWLKQRPRRVPVVMLTAHSADREEAMLGTSDRAVAAAFVATVEKPFNIDALVHAVREATGLGAIQPLSEANRNEELIRRLYEAGARDLRTSTTGREWAMFRVGTVLYKVYRWRAADVYFVGRYSPGGDQLAPLGQFYDLDSLIAYCLGRIGGGVAAPAPGESRGDLP